MKDLDALINGRNSSADGRTYADVKERGACGMRSGLSDWRLRNTGLKRKDPLQTYNIKNNKNNITNNKKPTQNNGLPLTYFVVWSKMFSETK